MEEICFNGRLGVAVAPTLEQIASVRNALSTVWWQGEPDTTLCPCGLGAGGTDVDPRRLQIYGPAYVSWN